MGVVLALALADVFLGWMVYQTRRGVTRDSSTDMVGLRSWYELQYAHGCNALNRPNLEDALQRELRAKRWQPVIAALGTMVLVLVVIALLATILISQLAPLSAWSFRLVLLIAASMRPHLMLMCFLVPVTLIEEVVIIRNVADFDIGRLRRLLDSLG